jgi:hypothetical protein
VVTAEVCRNRQGVFRGPNTACEGTTCTPPPAPTGACCVRGNDGAVTCEVVTQLQCAQRNGFYRGNGSACGDGACTPPPAPTGACCVQGKDGASCSITTFEACRTAGGNWGGRGSTCETINCNGVCSCDWNDDNRLNGEDFRTFLEDYRAGNADFDGDNDTDESDLRAFINCVRLDRDCRR